MTHRTLRFVRVAVQAGLLAMTACAPASTPTPPTAQAVATAVAPVASPIATAAAAASPAAATAVTAASPAAATAVAGASPAATSAAAASPVRITGVQFGADTTITVQNTSSVAVDLTGWKLRVGTASMTLPGNPRIGPNETLTLHAAGGTSAGRDLYLGQVAAPLRLALLPGVSIALLDASNNVMAEFTLPR